MTAPTKSNDAGRVWLRVRELIDRVLELPEDERDGFLRRSCGGDDTLRAEVVARVADCEAAAALLEAPVLGIAAPLLDPPTADDPTDADAMAGAVIGPYRVLRELGRGGMGAVYLAERADGHFEHQVALKVIKRGMDSDEIERRFRAERQILARLNHPHIARFFDGG